MKSMGLKIGVSFSGPGQTESILKALDIEFDGNLLFDSFQVTWNLLEQSCSKVCQEASDRGVTIIVKEALANGRLTDRNPFAHLATNIRFLKETSLELGHSMDAIAIALVLSQPWANLVLSGATTIEHLESNINSLDIVIPKDILADLDQFSQTGTNYWKDRSKLAWN